jgi:hypothetical protein
LTRRVYVKDRERASIVGQQLCSCAGTTSDKQVDDTDLITMNTIVASSRGDGLKIQSRFHSLILYYFNFLTHESAESGIRYTFF